MTPRSITAKEKMMKSVTFERPGKRELTVDKYVEMNLPAGSKKVKEAWDGEDQEGYGYTEWLYQSPSGWLFFVKEESMILSDNWGEEMKERITLSYTRIESGEIGMWLECGLANKDGYSPDFPFHLRKADQREVDLFDNAEKRVT